MVLKDLLTKGALSLASRRTKMEFKTFRAKSRSLGDQLNTAAANVGLGYFRKRRRRPPTSLSRQQSAVRRRRIGRLRERTHRERIVRTSNSHERVHRAVQRPTPTVGPDELQIIIASGRQGKIAAQDLWVSTRSAAGDPRSAPVRYRISLTEEAAGCSLR